MKTEIKNGMLFYNNINLVELALKFGTPLKVTFLDSIKNRIVNLKKAFDDAIEQQNYHGKFIYLNANKANYSSLEIEEAFINGDGLETSSYHDLLFTKDIFDKYNNKNKLIVCNGYKQDDYINEIIQMSNAGYNIITVIDSLNEYEKYKTRVNKSIKIGLRVHLSSLYCEEHEIIHNDRFGLMDNEIEYVLSDLKNHQNLVLDTVHFHQRGFEYNKDSLNSNINKAFLLYKKIVRLFPSLCNFDIGGGTPLTTIEFDYSSWANSLINLIKDECIKENIIEPNIISENGRYTIKDSTVNIYEVVGKKNTDEIPWYIINGSLLIAMPELYALGEDIVVAAINELDKELIKARLAGITCDCDDVFFDKEKGYLLLPKTDNKTFIGLLGTGSYQNSMSGKGGIHHCLLPEEKDVVVYTKDKQLHYIIRKETQTIEEMEALMKFKK